MPDSIWQRMVAAARKATGQEAADKEEIARQMKEITDRQAVERRMSELKSHEEGYVRQPRDLPREQAKYMLLVDRSEEEQRARGLSQVKPGQDMVRPEETRELVSLQPDGTATDDRTGQPVPSPAMSPGDQIWNQPEPPKRARDANGMVIMTPQQAAERLLAAERMKREKEAYVQRIIRNQ